jgi:hypothetical protein
VNRCDNCEKEWEDGELENPWPEMEHIGERLDPGGKVPSGECPECQALCYPIEPAPKKSGSTVQLTIENQDLHTILAALKVYQDLGYGEPANRPMAVHDIAIGGELDVISLDDAGIDDLCERINGGSACVTDS